MLAEKRMALAEALKRNLDRQQMEAELRTLIASQPMEAKRLEYQATLEKVLQQFQDGPTLHHALALLFIEVSTPHRIHLLTK